MRQNIDEELFEVELGNRKVHIVKVQRTSSQGRHRHTTKDGKNIHKTQAGRAGVKWSIPDSKAKDCLNTGLWKRRSNPYYTGEGGEGKALPNSIWEERKIKDMKTITWQEFFEISHYKNPGHYSSERVLWNNIAVDRKYRNTVLQGFRYSFIDGTNILDLSRPKDQLMYFFSLQCENSFLKTMADKKKYPRAMYVIQEINAPAEEEYKNNVQLDEAIVKLIDLKNKHTPDIVLKTGVILRIGTKNQSPESTYNALREFIMGDVERGNTKTNVARFNEVYDILKVKGGRQRFEMMYSFQEMLNHRIVVEEAMNFYWVAKRGTDNELLGKSREQVIGLLMDEDKAHVKQMLEKELADKNITL